MSREVPAKRQHCQSEALRASNRCAASVRWAACGPVDPSTRLFQQAIRKSTDIMSAQTAIPALAATAYPSERLNSLHRNTLPKPSERPSDTRVMSDSHLATHDDAEPFGYLVDASNAVLEALRDLDFKRGGDVAPRLANLYGYVAGELLTVNSQARLRPARMLKA
jgi:hypothetical protein